MIMKKILKAVFVASIMVVCFIMMQVDVNAAGAETGANLQNAVPIELNKMNDKTWYGNVYGDSFFAEFRVDKQGLIRIETSKPKDKNGVNGRVSFKVYNENGAAIWGCGTYNSKDDLENCYCNWVGLKPGKYYLAIEPQFINGSRDTSTITYGCYFEEDSYAEIEKNDSFDCATPIQLNEYYTGFIGDDGGNAGDRYDFWEIKLKKGMSYRLNVNFAENKDIKDVVVYDSKNNRCSSKFSVDEVGNEYYDFVAEQSGYYCIEIYSSGVQKIYFIKCSQINQDSDGYLYNGLHDGGDGNWYLYYNGSINTGYTGLYYDPVYGWWYVQNGMIDFGYTGLVQNEYGWWYVRNGAIDFNYNGLAQNAYGWWCIQNGAVDFSRTGLVYDQNVGWWYVENGAINFNYNGLVYDPYVGWWVVSNGAVNFGYTGMIANEYGWWFAVNGTLDFNATGWACNEYGWWLYYNGTIAWNYTGWWDGYYCVNGHLA